MSDYDIGVRDYNDEYDDLLADYNNLVRAINELRGYDFSYSLKKYESKYESKLSQYKKALDDNHSSIENKIKEYFENFKNFQSIWNNFDNFYYVELPKIKEYFDAKRYKELFEVIRVNKLRYSNINAGMYPDIYRILVRSEYKLRFTTLEQSGDSEFVRKFFFDLKENKDNLPEDQIREYIEGACKAFYKINYDPSNTSFEYLKKVVEDYNAGYEVYKKYHDLVADIFVDYYDEVSRIFSIQEEKAFYKDKDLIRCLEIYDLIENCRFRIKGSVSCFHKYSRRDFIDEYYKNNINDLTVKELDIQVNKLTIRMCDKKSSKDMGLRTTSLERDLYNSIFFESDELLFALDILEKYGHLNKWIICVIQTIQDQRYILFVASALSKSENYSENTINMLLNFVSLTRGLSLASVSYYFYYLMKSKFGNRSVMKHCSKRYLKIFNNPKCYRAATHTSNAIIRNCLDRFDKRNIKESTVYKPTNTETDLHIIRVQRHRTIERIITLLSSSLIMVFGAFVTVAVLLGLSIYHEAFYYWNALGPSIIGVGLSLLSTYYLVFHGRHSKVTDIYCFILSLISLSAGLTGLGISLSIYYGPYYYLSLQGILIDAAFIAISMINLWVLQPGRLKQGYKFSITTLVFNILLTLVSCAVIALLVLLIPIINL